MLTQEEQDFLKYWSEQRLRKKKTLRQFSIGLPMGVMIVLAVFVNVLVGWHKKAAMVMKSNGSIIVTVIVAAVGIVVFMTIFSRNHQWDMNEQRYQELLQKQANHPDPSSSTPATSN